MSASCRNCGGYQQFLCIIEDGTLHGDIMVVADNLFSHISLSTRTWLKDHPRIHLAFIRSPRAG
jgi:hypothetical protein